MAHTLRTDEQQLEWRRIFVTQITDRLAGDDEQKKQSLDLIFAAMGMAKQEGLQDAISVVRRAGEGSDNAAVQHVCGILGRNLEELDRLNAAHRQQPMP